MWRTPVGERILSGAEANVVCRAIAVLAERIESWGEELVDGGDFSAGIEVFDSLHRSQQLVLVEQVARYLLTNTVDPLPLNAATEATVGAIFEILREQVEIECDLHGMGMLENQWDSFAPTWRSMILAATAESLEVDEAEDYDLPSEDSCDAEPWDELIERLADRILWDRDYEMAELFLDDDPTTVAAKKAIMGIDEDYFVDLAPDPRDEELPRIRTSIQRLVQSKPR